MPGVPPINSDRFFDLAAAAIPAGAAAYSAGRLAPLLDWPDAIAILSAGVAVFAVGLLLMRAIGRRSRSNATAYSFSGERAFPAELLLETMWEEAVAADGELFLNQAVDDRIDVLAELILDDPLPNPQPDSRVVQLFATRPNAGELVNRIECHLGRTTSALPPAPADASDALRRALDELRRSLRQA